jgi:hypothetical protein
MGAIKSVGMLLLVLLRILLLLLVGMGRGLLHWWLLHWWLLIVHWQLVVASRGARVIDLSN